MVGNPGFTEGKLEHSLHKGHKSCIPWLLAGNKSAATLSSRVLRIHEASSAPGEEVHSLMHRIFRAWQASQDLLRRGPKLGVPSGSDSVVFCRACILRLAMSVIACGGQVLTDFGGGKRRTSRCRREVCRFGEAHEIPKLSGFRARLA